MTNERWAALYTLSICVIVSVFLYSAKRDPSRNKITRALVAAMNSRYWKSGSMPSIEARLSFMLYITIGVGCLMLFYLIFAPPVR